MIILRQKYYSSKENKNDSEDDEEIKNKKSKRIGRIAAGAIGVGIGSLAYGGLNAKKLSKYRKEHKDMKFSPKIDTTISEKVAKRLTGDDLPSTRLTLSNEMLLDPRGERFKEMRKMAEGKWGDRLYDKHKGIISKSHDKSSLFDVKNNLDDNFSRERLDDYYNQSKRILKSKADSLNKEEIGEARLKFKEDKKQLMSKIKSSNKKALIGAGLGAVSLGTGIYLIHKYRKKKKQEEEDKKENKL